MNVFTKIGLWVEKHFPEKMTTDQVNTRFQLYDLQLETLKELIRQLPTPTEFMNVNHEVVKLKEEFMTLKNTLTIKARIANSAPDTMTPFAQRFSAPHKPLGGNASAA